MDDNKRLVVALDFPSAKQAVNLAQQLNPSICRLKVGKELYTRCGPAILESLHALGFEIFLDLKFHDIPNTTARACGVAASLGVWMVNIHASGGRRMMEAAMESVVQNASNGERTRLIAVTVLTSMERSDLAEIGIDVEPVEQVKLLAKLTQSAGLDGVVCSAQEASILRSELGSEFQLVTPGIRPADSQIGDQRRIMTPRDAIFAGSTYLVVGRPISGSSDPALAAENIQREVEQALAELA